jgi:hypothetical protein
MQYLGRDMAITFAEQEPPERHALARRAQSYAAQERLHVIPRTAR